ncbi:MAG: hypothetical protein WEH44_07445 [Pirellulaceae bacterium]
MSQSYPPDSYPPPQQSSSTIIWIVVLVLVLVIGLPILLVALMFLGCCGLMGVGAYSAFQMSGEAAKQQFGGDPVIQEHLGEIQNISLNLPATNEEQAKGTALGVSVVVFDVSGPKGSGQLIAEQQPGVQPGQQPGRVFTKATLRTSQGEFPLSP